MKKETLLLGMFLTSIANSGLHASAEGFHVDRFALDVRTDYIVGHLWRNEPVRDEDIETAFSSVSNSRENSDASSDEESSTAMPTLASQIEEFIGEFIEITTDIANDRKKTQEERTSLNNFIEKVRARGERDSPVAVKYVLRMVADKY